MSDVDHPFHVMSLCAGIGGFDLGVQLAIPDARTVLFVEIEAYCIETLVSKMEAGLMDPAPVWTDLTTFDGRPFRGRVDLVVAGFPCQPDSLAGKRNGIEDDRWLWSDICQILQDVDPEFVLLENVPGLLSVSRGAAFEEVLRRLASLGYDAVWDVFSAAEVGAPHLRRRVFIFAWKPAARHPHHRRQSIGCSGLLDRIRSSFGNDVDGRSGAELAHGVSTGLEEWSGLGEHDDAERKASERSSRALANDMRGGFGAGVEDDDARQSDFEGGLPTMGNSECQRPQVEGRIAVGGIAAQRAGGELADRESDGRGEGGTESKGIIGGSYAPEPGSGAFPPGPEEFDKWQRVDPVLWPAAVVRSVRGVADGIPLTVDRIDRLRALGNGVVPLAVAYALTTLVAAAARAEMT